MELCGGVTVNILHCILFMQCAAICISNLLLYRYGYSNSCDSNCCTNGSFEHFTRGGTRLCIYRCNGSCGNCGVTSLASDYSITYKKNVGILLTGKCVKCGNDVCRVVEDI